MSKTRLVYRASGERFKSQGLSSHLPRIEGTDVEFVCSSVEKALGWASVMRLSTKKTHVEELEVTEVYNKITGHPMNGLAIFSQGYVEYVPQEDGTCVIKTYKETLDEGIVYPSDVVSRRTVCTILN